MTQQFHSWVFIPQNTKTLIQKDSCIPMFKAALFMIAKTWKQPKYPTTDEWIKKMWYTHTYTHTHTHNAIVYSHKKD